MEDNLNLFERGRRLYVFKNENNLNKIMQPKTIKSKDNGCGTAPGNLVNSIYQFELLEEFIRKVVEQRKEDIRFNETLKAKNS